MQREIELIQYLPGFLQRIREYQIISQIETPEIKLLYKIIENTSNNGFIKTADLQGMKRWEQLTDITPLGNLEERRTAVLGKWNRAIPYTLIRLYEYLDALVARDNYVIRLSPSDYWIGLDTHDLPFYLIKAMRELVRAMIPANMIFDLTNKIPMTAAIILLHVEAGIQMHSSFYPRHNIPYLYYDGAAYYNGVYCYSQYKIGDVIDLYPAALALRGDYQVRTLLDNCKVRFRGIPARLPIMYKQGKVAYMASNKVPMQSDNYHLAMHTEAVNKTRSRLRQIKMHGIKARLRASGRVVKVTYTPGIKAIILPGNFKTAAHTSIKPKVPRYKVDLTIGYHLTHYDGLYCYNGSRRYNSKVIVDTL